jgi:hypothetical protein
MGLAIKANRRRIAECEMIPPKDDSAAFMGDVCLGFA